MRLIDALRLGAADKVALVGAGGKTTALFRLGGEAPTSSVIVTTTTHLAVEQTELADRYFTIHSPAEVEASLASDPEGVLLFSGSRVENGRVEGLDGESLECLRRESEARSWPLLIEADGGRQRALKAPAEHEPVIPGWVDVVIVVAGLTGLGQSLGTEWVHRPEQFAALADLGMGEAITPAAVVRVLSHPQGGLKNIPLGARRVILLNQADDAQRQAQAGGMAKALLRQYSQVVVACLSAPSGGERQPGLGERPANDDSVLAVHERIAGIVLAAGASTRVGTPKQLLEWRGQPLVRRAAQTALESGLEPVVVVTGANAEQVQAVLADLPVQSVFNPTWADGQSTSLVAGLQRLPAETGGAVFLLADQPLVSVGLVRSLVEQHSRTMAPIVAPLVDGQRGNPVLFDRRTYPDLLALSGDVGGRALFARTPVDWVTWHDRGVLLDIDTPDDYHRLQEVD